MLRNAFIYVCLITAQLLTLAHAAVPHAHGAPVGAGQATLAERQAPEANLFDLDLGPEHLEHYEAGRQTEAPAEITSRAAADHSALALAAFLLETTTANAAVVRPPDGPPPAGLNPPECPPRPLRGPPFRS